MAWIPIVASVAGGAASGAAGSKKGGSGSNAAADTQARLASQLFGETDPIRQALIGRSAQFLGAPSGGMYGAAPTASPDPYAGGGGIAGLLAAARAQQPSGTPSYAPITGGSRPFDVTASPEYAATMDATNRQFARAKDASIATTPAGGALTESLVGLEGQRAGALAQGAGTAYGDEISRAMSLATGQTAPALGALGTAAQAQAYSAQAASLQNAQKGQMLGQGLGTYMGNKPTGAATAGIGG